jgi:RimJ/RimL family protein N-acetyltransferase
MAYAHLAPTRAIPEIDAPRLLLRGHTVADFAESAAMWADPEVTRYIGGRPSTEEEAWARLLRYAGSWALLGFGYWLIREKGSGRFVGEVGFADFRRQMAPSLGEAPEIGWVLSPSVHGKGYATEAAQAVIAWGERSFGVGVRTACIIDPANVASLRVAEKCGYREVCRTTYKGDDTVVLERGGLAPRSIAARGDGG